ncbi:cadmium resistance transporter [Argonema antarcticum]|uniref:cadmium resistance transporter n=1 Tax=Argonema antarcticum TaxID=2942763 RepID=UPI002013815C|nr:cadmium resistance transporter [Argonema antarcticum]MCL1473428.1 cadmium resistance transporter [Argonema antarcticum A004/B2]
MSQLLTSISTALAAFSATNIDDIVILTLFFSQVNATFRRQHIVAGQYLGFSALIAVSLPAFFSGLILPPDWIGMLGVVPIAIGLNRLLNRETDESEVTAQTDPCVKSLLTSFLSPQTYGVAAITMANGSDNISIYVPLFASSTWSGLLVILGVFFLLVGVWCYAAYQLTRLPAIADALTRYGNSLVPFVLVGLGISILVESGTLASIPLTGLTFMAGCGCLFALNKNNKQLEAEKH